MPAAVASVPQESACPICGVGRGQWIDLSGRHKVQCPGCGAAERHRALAHAWADGLGALLDLRGKRVLAMRPDRADLNFLKHSAARPMTFDIMPRGDPDMVGDLSNLRLPNDRFDLVLSHLMLATAPDPRAAVREIARVLRPDGAAVFYESLEPGRVLREIVDPVERMAWYGREAYERHGVGVRREWGLLDLEALLSDAFHVRLVEGVDPATGRRYVFFWCTRRAPSDGPFLDEAGRFALLAGLAAPELRARGPHPCGACGESFQSDGDEACPACGAGARARGLPRVVRDFLPQVVDAEVAASNPLLVFDAAAGEVAALRKLFPTIGVALPHADPRDLSELPDGSLAAVIVLAAFEGFAEHGRALSEAWRATAPGGGLALTIRASRLRAGSLPATPDPDDPGVVSVGREWLLDAMTWAGWAAGAVQLHDPATGEIHTWFLGRKPA